MTDQTQVSTTASPPTPSDLETETQPTDLELRRRGDEWWDRGPGARSLSPEEADLLDDGEGNSWW